MPAHPEAQAAFSAALVGQGVPPGVTAVGDLDRRFSVYRNTVMHSLTDALAQRFPAVRRIVGAQFFDTAAGVFVRAHPPKSPLIHAYGADFPTFLAEFPPAATLAYLADVARIECMRGQSYHAADAKAVSPAAFGQAVGAAPDTATLTLHPSLHVMISDQAAVSIWRMNQPGAVPAPVAPCREAALIFRDGAAVIVRPVTPTIAGITAALAQGTPLGAAMSADAPDEITQTLSLLLRHGLIVGVTLHQN